MSSDVNQRIKSLKSRQAKVVAARAELAAETKLKKDQLSQLVKEIRAAGVAPETLEAELAKAEKDLQEKLDEFEAELAKAEALCKITP